MSTKRRNDQLEWTQKQGRDCVAQYKITFRYNAGKDMDATTVRAFRIEGWNNDYAFFGDVGDLGKITCIVPRDTVLIVEMIDQEPIKK